MNQTMEMPVKELIEFVPEYYAFAPAGVFYKSLPDGKFLCVNSGAGIPEAILIERRIDTRNYDNSTPGEFLSALRKAQDTINRAALL